MGFRAEARLLAAGAMLLHAAAGEAQPGCCTVPARTPVEIVFDETVSTRSAQIGARFAFHLSEPLAIDGRIVAPAGTAGVGQVVHAARPRGGGRAGELILAARYLEVGGRQVPLRSLRYGPRSGRDRSTTIGMAAALLGPTALRVSGGHVDVPAGATAQAMIAEDVVLAPID